MPDPISSTSVTPLAGPGSGTSSAAAAPGGPGASGGPGSGGAQTLPADAPLAADQLTPGDGAKGTIPAVSPRMFGLMAPVGGSLANPAGSNWTNRNDIRLVLPVYMASDGAISASLATLPGRNQAWVTVGAAQAPADNRFNFDGLQGAVRFGVAGPGAGMVAVPGTPMHLDQLQQLQWGEFRVGAEGLVVSGRMVDGKVSVTSFDLEQGFFRAKLDDVGDWSLKNLAIAIPVGLVAVGGAVGAAHVIADKTGKDLAIPLGFAVYNKNGIYVRPSVRPIFGADQFLKFGGADLNLGYTQPGKFSVNLVPGYNNDPALGPKGFSAGARATVALPFNGTAGAEVRYDQQGGVAAYAGVNFTF